MSKATDLYTILDMFLDGDSLSEAIQKKKSEMSPEELAKEKDLDGKAKDFLAKNPVHHMNIVNSYNQASPESVRQGKAWYSNISKVSKAVAHTAGISHQAMAGLYSTYSPKHDWDSNRDVAEHVALNKDPIGGPGNSFHNKRLNVTKGVNASGLQKEAATKLLNGAHWHDVIKGFKTRAFAHLIEHGGQGDSKTPVVCVDRHAISVARGARVSERAFGHCGLKNKKQYQEAADAYVHAAKHLSEQHGHEITPEQVQAVTWMHQREQNKNRQHVDTENW